MKYSACASYILWNINLNLHVAAIFLSFDFQTVFCK